MLRAAFFLGLTLTLLSAHAETGRMSARLSNYTSYFFSDSKLRHHRYELLLKESAPISKRLTHGSAVRFRVDPVLYDADWAPRHDFPKAVRDDEGFEVEIRNLYIDYLTDFMRIKVGVQQIDWVESLTPFTSDLLTALDLRQGGFGTGEDLIMPQYALTANHKLGPGTLEYLVVALPKTSRLPLGYNAYGYTEYLQSLAAPATANLVHSSIPPRFDDTEFGARYLANFEGFDLSAVAYRGHQRMPSLTVTQTGATTVNIEENYPKIWTFGVASAYSADAWVGRLFFYFEPDRQPRSFIVNPLVPATGSSRRMRLGGGFDYIFSKDFKLYSEFFGNQTDDRRIDTAGNVLATTTRHDALISTRLTSESITDVELALTASASVPEWSFMLNPEVKWTASRYIKLSAGARWIHSDSREATFELLKNASQVYFLLTAQDDLK